MNSLIAASLLTLAVAGAAPQETAAVDKVDLIEVNHLYDQQGRHVIDQLIFYDWDSSHGRFQVRAWRLIKSPGQMPQRDWSKDAYVSYWRDMHVMRRVYASRIRETWTTYDPEVLEREVLPIEYRQELSQAAPTRRRVAAN